jgi:hypothetical protein
VAALGLVCACSPDPYGFGSEGSAAPVEPSDTGASTSAPGDPSTSSASETVDTSTTGRLDDTTASTSGEPPPGESSTTEALDTDGPKELEHCAMPNAPIPDDDPSGVSSTLQVPEAGTIVDVRVELQLAHEFIGDLRVGLLGNAGQVGIIDRPDDDDSRFEGGCGGVNIDAVLHDAAASTVDQVCLDDANPGLHGEVRPDALLGPVFAGTPTEGTWRLLVVDAAGNDIGTLQSWCLRITYE